MKRAQAAVAPTKSGTGERRCRCKLDSLIDWRREAARIYRAGLSGTMAVDDVRQLASVLRIIGGLIVDGELEQRVRELKSKCPTT